MKLTVFLATVIASTAAAQAPANYPAPVEADYIARNFVFTTGKTMPELRIHYTTIGTRAPDGRNAVLIMHGTGGSGRATT